MDAKHEPGGVTTALATWAAELTLAAVPAEVIAHLKTCLLDSIGCGLFGALQPWGRAVSDVAVDLSSGGVASLFARREKVSPADAALANGTAIHGFELDDAHVGSSLHPGSVALPTSLATAEVERASGEQFLTALAAGYEVGLRLGVCAGVAHSTSGYHVTGTVGAVGAAAAAARVLSLSPVQFAHALGIGATQAAGLYVARLGAMTKRFHAGRAAQSGVLSAYLAQRGFTGGLEALEAPFGGFLSTLRGQFDAATMLSGLGERWETALVGLKPYAACASAHTTIDGVLELRSRGLSLENLERLMVRASRKGHINIGWPYRPGEVITAQMNGSYAAAVALIDGDAFIDQFDESRLSDPAILALMPRIIFLHDAELDRGGATKRHAVRIEALRRDGSVLSTEIEQRRGSPDHPLGVAEVERKFRRLAAAVLSARDTEDVMGLVATIEREGHLERLISLIGGRAV
jgi:2-methylcitrate dehydratase PrpD